MLVVTTVETNEELQEILELQQQNHIQNIDEMEMETQGFVTLKYDISVLQQMHNLAPSVVAKENNRVAGYALVMLKECRDLFPPLESMFSTLDLLTYENKPLNEYRFYIMGQVCIDKKFRRTGLFDQLYQKHKENYAGRFDFVVTEVSTRNHRSLRAHKRVGFEIIDSYNDDMDEWAVVLWNWK